MQLNMGKIIIKKIIRSINVKNSNSEDNETPVIDKVVNKPALIKEFSTKDLIDHNQPKLLQQKPANNQLPKQLNKLLLLLKLLPQKLPLKKLQEEIMELLQKLKKEYL